MKKFILGYIDTDTTDADNPNDLTLFSSKQEADFESDEWVEVEADTLEEAKLKYHDTFKKWQENPY